MLVLVGVALLMTGCEYWVEKIVVDGCEYVIVRTEFSASITSSPTQPDGCYDRNVVKEEDNVETRRN